MQTALFIAAGVAAVVGIVHSVLGEVLIFRHLSLFRTKCLRRLGGRNVRVIWAILHLASVFRWAFAVVLERLVMDINASLTCPVVGASLVEHCWS